MECPHLSAYEEEGSDHEFFEHFGSHKVSVSPQQCRMTCQRHVEAGGYGCVRAGVCMYIYIYTQMAKASLSAYFVGKCLLETVENAFRSQSTTNFGRVFLPSFFLWPQNGQLLLFLPFQKEAEIEAIYIYVYIYMCVCVCSCASVCQDG